MLRLKRLCQQKASGCFPVKGFAPRGCRSRKTRVSYVWLRARESNHRVEFRGTTRGQIAGQKRDRYEKKRNRQKRSRIIWPHIEKQTCHDARETEGTGQSGHNT